MGGPIDTRMKGEERFNTLILKAKGTVVLTDYFGREGEGTETYLSKAGFEIQLRIASFLPFRIHETSLLTCVLTVVSQTHGITRSCQRPPLTNAWQLEQTHPLRNLLGILKKELLVRRGFETTISVSRVRSVVPHTTPYPLHQNYYFLRMLEAIK